MTKPQIILVGAGGHCRSCIDVIEQEGRFVVAGVVDHPDSADQTPVLGYPVLGTDDDLSDLRKRYDYALVTVGQIRTPSIRIQLFKRLGTLGFERPVVCSPRAYISKHAKVGSGTIVMHDVLINAGACVGDNCIVNTKALIEHDVRIGTHCHIATGAIINGGTIVGDGTFFGSNAVSVQGITIRPASFICAGSLERGAR